VVCSCVDGGKAAVRLWNITSARGVVSPGDYRAIVLKSKAVVPSCGYGGKTAVRLWDITLAIAVVSPGD